MASLKNMGLSLILLLFLASCKTGYFPLCPRLAATHPGENDIGARLLEACKKHHIKITVLSSNVAEFKGNRKQLQWLRRNYAVLLCDFNESDNSLDALVYTSCLDHANNWIKIVQEKRFQDLMRDGTIYCPVCMPNQNCH